jgi:hypothetical protein
MSISGPEALAALDEALRDLRREEDDILRKLLRGHERLAKIRDSESELLRQLAILNLPADRATALIGAVAGAAQALRQTLDARGRDFAAAVQRRRQLETALGERRGERGARLGEIDHGQQQLRALAGRLGATAGYDRQRQAAAALAARAQAALARCRQAEIDSAGRLRSYRDDPLFAYLLDRGYGTPAYRGGLLAGPLDRAVARLARFGTAHRDYALIAALPGQLAAHAEAEARRAAAAAAELDALENAAIGAAGGAAALAAVTGAKARIAELDDRIAALEAERSQLVATQTALLEIDGSAFGRAVDALIQALGSTSLAALIADRRVAAATSPDGAGGEDTTLDDAFTAQLDDVRLRLAEEQADARDFHARLAVLAERRRALEGVERELKARHLDDPRALFHDAGLVGPRLDDVLTGRTDAPTYLAQWLEAQAWTAGTADWGGGIGLPQHGRGLPEAPRRQPARPAAPAHQPS